MKSVLGRIKVARRARHVECVPVRVVVDLWYLCSVLLADYLIQ